MNIPGALRNISEQMIREYRRAILAVESDLEKEIEKVLRQKAEGKNVSAAARQELLFKVRQERQAIERALLAKSDYTIAKLMQFQARMAGGVGIDGAFLTDRYRNIAAQTIKAETAKFFKKEIKPILDGMQRKLTSQIGTALDAVADYDAAQEIFTSGIIRGQGVAQIAKNIAQGAMGPDNSQAWSYLVGAIRADVAKIDTMAKLGYAEDRPTIVGVTLLRGPGECPSGICGAALGGISENETADFLLVNGVPQPPFHPRCFCAIIGYIYADESEIIKSAYALDKRITNDTIYQAAKTGDWRDTAAAAKRARDIRARKTA